MRHLIQAVQDTSPSLLRTTNTNLLTSAGDDKPPIPSPRQWVIPQSLYRPVESITWRESQECTIGRITFDLKTEVPGKQGVPMSILLNEPESVVAKALQQCGSDWQMLFGTHVLRTEGQTARWPVIWSRMYRSCRALGRGFKHASMSNIRRAKAKEERALMKSYRNTR